MAIVAAWNMITAGTTTAIATQIAAVIAIATTTIAIVAS
jgi:hypothetical protein